MAKIVYIADVCKEIFAGGDVPKSALSYEKTAEYNVPIFSNGEKDCGLYGYTNNARVKEPSITVSARGTIGYTAIRTEPFVPVVRLITLTPKSEVIDLDYLFYATQNYRFEGSGTSIPQLTVPMLKKYKFQLPEMSHQKAIAVKFEKLDQLISLRKQQLAKLDELVKAQFANTFENDANFHTDYMENLSEFVTVGIANSATHAYAEHGVVMLRNQNIKENHLDDTELVYIEPKFADKYKSKKLEANDILVTRTGYPGIACVVPQKYAGSQTFTTLIIRLKKGTNASSCYICHYINSSHGKKYVSGTKVGVAQQNFGAKVLAKMPVIVPPIELQNQFATFVARIDQQKQTIQQSLEKLELMKKALMQEYFG